MAKFPSFLTERYQSFRQGAFAAGHKTYRHLAANGQSPQVMVISCADSRVQPETIFESAPGEIFAVRNIANLVPPYETAGKYHGVSAALEFAVLNLKVKHIVVLGHSQCGGIHACLHRHAAKQSSAQFISNWMSMLDRARDYVLAQNSDAPEAILEREGIRNSLTNLRTFPEIQKLESEGKLFLHGAHFDIAQGLLSVLDEDKDAFVPLVREERRSNTAL